MKGITTSALPPSRSAALAALERILPLGGGSGQDLQAALDATLRSQCPDPRDRGLATELVYGYLRLKGRMDRLVANHLSKPDRTHPAILRVLGLACYELLHLGGVPDHATLSWGVEAVKARLGQSQANLVNAVLRRVQALGKEGTEQAYYKSVCKRHLDFLSVWYSCPEWLVKLWIDDYGQNLATDLLEAQLLAPLTCVRVNAAKPGARALYGKLESLYERAAGAFPYFAANSDMLSSGDPHLLQAEDEGRVTRQSAAVGYLLHKLDMTRWDGPIWDCCCGRGGKTLAMLEAGHPDVWASDMNARRLRGLTRDALRLGLPCPTVFFADTRRPPLANTPATVLVDAPCTGLGVLSRRPDTKWKRSQADIATLAALQGEMLSSLGAWLPSGSRLVYATCTMTKAENEAQVEKLLPLGWDVAAKAEPEKGLPMREAMWGVALVKR